MPARQTEAEGQRGSQAKSKEHNLKGRALIIKPRFSKKLLRVCTKEHRNHLCKTKHRGKKTSIITEYGLRGQKPRKVWKTRT